MSNFYGEEEKRKKKNCSGEEEEDEDEGWIQWGTEEGFGGGESTSTVSCEYGQCVFALTIFLKKRKRAEKKSIFLH